MRLSGAGVEDVHEVGSTREARNGAVAALLDYLRGHFERFSGVSSHRVLADLFRRSYAT